MSVKFSAWGNHQFVIPATGAPASGYKLYTYVAGSSTPVSTYTTNVGDVPQSNPIVLNAAGFPTTGQIWITEGASIKIVFTDASDVVVKTEDRIPGVNDAAITSDQWVAGPAPTYISAVSFSLVGDQTSTFQVGRRVKTTNSGGTIYSTISASTFGAVTTVTVVNDSGTLDSGLSAVSYGLLSSLNPSDPRSVGVTVAAHATTSNIWASTEVVLTGGAVTFTDIADAPYVGAVAWVKQNAAHVWNDGAVFEVQGNANYTAVASDWIRVQATTVSTFSVTIFKADGTAVVAAAAASPITNSLGADVALNNASNYFTGPTVAQGSVGTWLASGTVTLLAVGSTTNFDVKLWDGTTVIASGRTICGTSGGATISLSGYLATPAGNLRISAKASATDALITFNSSGNSKDSTLTAIRIA